MSVSQARGMPGTLHSQARYEGDGTQVNGDVWDERRTNNFYGTVDLGQQHHHHYHYNFTLHDLDRARQSLPMDDTQPQSSHVAGRNAESLATYRRGVFNSIISPCEAVWWLCSCCLGYVRSARA